MLEARRRAEDDGARTRQNGGRDLVARIDDAWDLLDALDLQFFERTAAAPRRASGTDTRPDRLALDGEAKGRELEWL